MAGLLSTVRAQPTAVATLQRALASGRVHHAYLFDGPEGVGKERAALGLAQALVCEQRPEGSGDACGACSACRRALVRPGERRPVHPDVVLLERGLYEAAMIGRKDKEGQELSVDQVRTLVLARAAFPPHEGRAKVFVVRRAEELSTSAANALLKTLEEPGPRTHFVLLSSMPETLLPTVRSRTQRVRFGPLPEEVVAELLAEQGAEAARAAALAHLSGGSMLRAAALADPDASAARDQFVSRALDAVVAPELGAALDFAADAKAQDKDVLSVQLEALAAALGAAAREHAAEPTGRAVLEATRHALVLSAIRQLEANASSQLAIETMLIRMRAV